jgi:hypothetical protein
MARDTGKNPNGAPGAPPPPPPAPPPAAGAYDADEHLLPVSEVAARYGTHVDPSHPDGSRGLPEAAVSDLRAKWGRNALTPPKQTPEILKLLLQFCNPLLAMLTLACVLTFLVYAIQSPPDEENLILACVMAGVIVVLAFVSYAQERSAGNVMGASRFFVVLFGGAVGVGVRGSKKQSAAHSFRALSTKNKNKQQPL